MRIPRYIAGGLLAAAIPAAHAGLLGAGVLSGNQSGEGGAIGVDLVNADNLLGLQLLGQPLLGQAPQGLPLAVPGLPFNTPRNLLPTVSLSPLAGLALGRTGGSANGDLINSGILSGGNSGNGRALGLAVANGGNSGNGGVVGAAVLSGNNSGNGGLIGASVLSGDNSGNSGLLAASVLSGNNSGNVGDGLLPALPAAPGLPGFPAVPAIPAFSGAPGLPGIPALPGLGGGSLQPSGLASVRIVNQPAGRRGLIDAGLLNTDFLASLSVGDATLLQLPPGTPALYDALSALRDQLRAGGASLTPVLLGLASGIEGSDAGNPLEELALGELAELSIGAGGDSAARLLSIRLLDGSGTANADAVGASVLGAGNNANAGAAGVSLLGGNTSGNGGVAGTSVLGGAGSGNGGAAGLSVLGASQSGNGGLAGASILGGSTTGNGGLVGLAALSGEDAGNGGIAGVSVLSGDSSGNGGLLGIAVLSGDGSGNTGVDGLAAVQLASGDNSGNGGLTTASLLGGSNSGNPGTGPALDPGSLLGLIMLVPDNGSLPAPGAGLPGTDSQPVGVGLLNSDSTRPEGGLLDAGIIENDKLLTVDAAGQTVLDISLLGPELTDVAAGLADALGEASVALTPVLVPLPTDDIPVLGLNQPGSGDGDLLAVVGLDLLDGPDGAGGNLAGVTILASGDGNGTGGSNGGSTGIGDGDLPDITDPNTSSDLAPVTDPLGGDTGDTDGSADMIGSLPDGFTPAPDGDSTGGGLVDNITGGENGPPQGGDLAGTLLPGLGDLPGSDNGTDLIAGGPDTIGGNDGLAGSPDGATQPDSNPTAGTTPGTDGNGLNGNQDGNPSNNLGNGGNLANANPDATGTDANSGNGLAAGSTNSQNGDGTGSEEDRQLSCVADVAEEEIDRPLDDERQCNREEADTLASR